MNKYYLKREYIYEWVNDFLIFSILGTWLITMGLFEMRYGGEANIFYRAGMFFISVVLSVIIGSIANGIMMLIFSKRYIEIGRHIKMTEEA